MEATAPVLAAGCALSIVDCYRNPLFVVEPSGQLLYCNRAGKAVLRAKAGFAVRNGMLHLGSKPAVTVLQRIVLASHRPEGEACGCHGIRFPRLNGSRDWLVLVRSLAPAAGAQSAAPFLLHAVARTTPRALPPQVLEDLFGLTRREIMVIAELARSGTVRIAAQRLSLSTETIRSHVKKAFQKCDVHSRAELIALLQGVAEFACE